MEKMSETVDEIMSMPEQKRAQKMMRIKELLMKMSEEGLDDLMKEIRSAIN